MAILNGDLLRVAARMVWNGANDVMNVFYARCDDNNSQSTEDLIEDLILAVEALYNVFDGSLANNVTMADMSVSNLTQDEVYGASPWPTLTAGGDANAAINPALGVFAYSPTTIPNVQGRKFFGPFTEASNEDGVWNAAVLALIDTVMASLQTAFPSAIGATLFPVIAHLKEVIDGEIVDVIPPVLRQYVSTTVTNNAGVLTRRRPGSGS